MSRRIAIYGFDPALRHGQLVRCVWEFEKNRLPLLLEGETVFVWGRKDEAALNVKSTAGEIHRLTNQIITSLDSRATAPIAIDWDPASINWRARRDQMVRVSFFMGYLTRALLGIGMTTVFISPSQVREAFDLSPKTHKRDVWLQVLGRYFRAKPDAFTRVSSDYKDAVILTYILARAIQKEGVDAGTGPANLPGG